MKRQDEDGRHDGVGRRVAKIATVVGFISGTIAIIEFILRQFNIITLVALLVLSLAAPISTAGAILGYFRTLADRRTRWFQSANFALAVLWLLGVGGMIGALIPTIRDSPPPPSTMYLTSEGTGATDERPGLGPPIVLSTFVERPKNDYTVRETLGYGYPVEPPVPGTHLVYDHFCGGSDSDELCGGVRRSHFYSTSEDTRPSSWSPAGATKPVARLFNADLDGECSDEASVVIYSFEKKGANGVQLFDVAELAADDSWRQVELLGCLRPVQ